MHVQMHMYTCACEHMSVFVDVYAVPADKYVDASEVVYCSSLIRLCEVCKAGFALAGLVSSGGSMNCQLTNFAIWVFICRRTCRYAFANVYIHAHLYYKSMCKYVCMFTHMCGILHKTCPGGNLAEDTSHCAWRSRSASAISARKLAPSQPSERLEDC